MSQSLRRETTDFLRDYGATHISVEPGGKHPKIRFTFKGKDHSIVIPGTASDYRALENQKADIRRLLGDPMTPTLRKKRKLEDMVPAVVSNAVRQEASRHSAMHHGSHRLGPFPDIHNKPGTFLSIFKGEIECEPAYQRELNKSAVARIAVNWSWPACGVLLVSKRAGKYYVFDGQHRWAAAKERADVNMLPCMLFEALDLKAEASGFIAANTERRAMYLADQFKALLISDDEQAKKIEELVKSIKRRVERQSGPHTVSCVSEIMSALRMDEAALRRIWHLVGQIAEGNILQSRLLKGIFSLESRMPKGVSLSDARFSAKLIAAGNEAILHSIRDVVAIEGNAGRRPCATGVLRLINKGSRSPLQVNLEGMRR